MSCGPCPYSSRTMTEPANVKPWFKTWGWRIFSSIWGGMRSWVTLLPSRWSWQHLLSDAGRDNRWNMSPWVPQSFDTVKKDTGPIQFGGKMPRCAMCSFPLLHGELTKYREAPFSAYSTLFPFSFLLISMQSSYHGLERYLSSHYRRKWSRDVSSSKAKPKWPHLLESLSCKHAFLWLSLNAPNLHLLLTRLNSQPQNITYPSAISNPGQGYWATEIIKHMLKGKKKSLRNDISPCISDFLK